MIANFVFKSWGLSWVYLFGNVTTHTSCMHWFEFDEVTQDCRGQR